MVEKMPEQYKGKVNKGGGFTDSSPRVWTDFEIEWVKKLRDSGCSAADIAYSVDRTKTSVAVKLKRLSKKENNYNAEHVSDKYEVNDRFIEHLKPESVLDCYCGVKSFYGSTSVTNDIDEGIPADYHMDALKFLCMMYMQGKKFDLVDLDPYGSAYECFDLAMKIAQKGIVITYGELGHKRWKRLDFVRRCYGISRLEDFTLDALIEYTKEVGARNKKRLTVYEKREWRNIGRVWFEIEPIRITEQWDKTKKQGEQLTLLR